MADAAEGAPFVLGYRHVPALRTLLEQDVDSNIFLCSALDRWGVAASDGVRWLGAGSHQVLHAIVWCGRPVPDPGATVPAGLAVPFGSDFGCRDIGTLIAQDGPPHMVIGPRQAADAMWQGTGQPRPRIWYDQRLYVCKSGASGRRLELRLARPDELEEVSEITAEMMREDLGQDPREADPDEHRRKVRARVLGGRTLVGIDDGEIVFKVDIGSTTPQGAQVGGTWVARHRRGEGLASAGMRAACDRLLQRVPRVTLHVNEANRPAVRTYVAAGFDATTPFRLASH